MENLKDFIHIRSSKFPILPDEKEEIVNEGTYGKALAQYLQIKLKDRGYDVPFICCEDWGWWVELKSVPFTFGVCIYSGPEKDGPIEFVCTDGARGEKKWNWKKFRFIDTRPWVKKLREDLMTIFQTDKDIEIIGTFDEFPFSLCFQEKEGGKVEGLVIPDSRSRVTVIILWIAFIFFIILVVGVWTAYLMGSMG
jgi:hypothetical protein